MVCCKGMSNKYILKVDDVIEIFNELSQSILNKYKQNGVKVNFGYDLCQLSSATISNPMIPLKQIDVSVGIKRLDDNAYDDYICSQDLVYCLHDAFHEERHVYQRAVLYQDKDANQNVVDMAKCDIVSGVLKEYEKIVYHHKPSEVDAELYGWQKTIDYFDTHFLDKNGHPLIDARAEMLDELHDIEYDRNRSWSGDTWASSYENAIKSLEENMDYYKNTTFDLFKPRQKITEYYKQFIQANYGRFAHAYANAKTPVDAKQVLFEFAYDIGEVSTLAFPCLKESVEEVKSGQRRVVPKMPIYESMRYKGINLLNSAFKNKDLRFQDVENRMYDEQSAHVHSSNRSFIQQQSSRDVSLDRLVRNINYSDTQSEYEHNGLS